MVVYFIHCVSAEQAFKELGETLKRKRQFDFHESITSYIESSTCDPATGNQILEEKLEENRKLYGNRIDEVSLSTNSIVNVQ